MSTNPYASPADAAAPLAGNPLKPVAILLLAMSIVWMIFCAIAVLNFLGAAASTQDDGLARVYRMNSASLLTCLVFQIVLISGAISMLRRSSYLWSFVTCWLACIPALSPCYLLAIPVGIWGLAVMWRPSTRALFPATPAGRDPVLGVVIGLVTMSVAWLVFCVFGVIYFVTNAPSEQGWRVIWMPLVVLAGFFLYSLGVIYGARKMASTGSYRGAVITCVLACVPILGPCYFATIPLGIWGLLILRRPEVREGWDGPRPATGRRKIE